MTEKNAEGSSNLELPSQGYFRARESGVSRLSELMFGSLLASYVLGFVSFAAATSPESKSTVLLMGSESLVRFVITVDYLAISLTFTFITSALYVSYHIGILTMPTTPFDRLSWDFFIALAQACCFGFSLLFQELFPFFLLIAILLTLWRQHFESQKLLAALRGPDRFEPIARRTTRVRDAASYAMTARVRKFTKQLNREILNKIKNHPELVGWQGVQPKSIGAVIGLLVIAVVGWLEILGLMRSAVWLPYFHVLIHAGIATLTGYFTHRAIKDRGTLLVDLVPEKRDSRVSELAVSTSVNAEDSDLSPFDRAAKAFYVEVDNLHEITETTFEAEIKQP